MYYLIQSYSSNNEKDFNQKMEILGSNGLDMSAVQKNGNTLYHLAIENQALS